MTKEDLQALQAQVTRTVDSLATMLGSLMSIIEQQEDKIDDLQLQVDELEMEREGED